MEDRKHTFGKLEGTKGFTEDWGEGGGCDLSVTWFVSDWCLIMALRQRCFPMSCMCCFFASSFRPVARASLRSRMRNMLRRSLELRMWRDQTEDTFERKVMWKGSEEESEEEEEEEGGGVEVREVNVFVRWEVKVECKEVYSWDE